MTEPVHLLRAVGVKPCQPDLLIDCCSFLVLVRLIAHEVCGGCKNYRNSKALKKAEAEQGLPWFCGCSYAILVDVLRTALCIYRF